MLTLSIAAVLALDVMIPSEEAQRLGLAARARAGAVIVFISHQWLSWQHPDPEGFQLRCAQGFFKKAICGQVFGRGKFIIKTMVEESST